MKKKILVFVFFTLALFIGIIFNSMLVEAAGDEITATHVFTTEDFNDCNNSPENTTFTFELDGFVVEIVNKTKKYLEKVDQNGATIKSGTFITVKPRKDYKLISFEMNKNSRDSESILNCPVTNAVLDFPKDSTCIKYTPIDDTNDIVININATQYYILNFAITYSIPHTHNYSDVFNFDSTNHWIECECGDKQSNNPHVIDGNYSYDDNSHWYGCETCKYKSEEQEHNFDNGVTTTPSITDAKPGKTVYTCQTCNYEKTVYSYLDINDEKISIYYKNTLTYNGQEQSQKLNVYYDDVELTEGVHYTLSGNDATNAGDYI